MQNYNYICEIQAISDKQLLNTRMCLVGNIFRIPKE